LEINSFERDYRWLMQTLPLELRVLVVVCLKGVIVKLLFFGFQIFCSLVFFLCISGLTIWVFSFKIMLHLDSKSLI
jgi:hypothetical protein